MLTPFLASLFLIQASGNATQKIYSEVEPSIVTVEVHSGHDDAKNSLGSGYFIDKGGRIITNYHVVSSFVDRPDELNLRVINQGKKYDAQLLHFDLENDLALLQSDQLRGPPLKLSSEASLRSGQDIVSLGNPHGLRISIIDGLFNGFAEKGLVDRMLLSMPLNSGMSGGPILDRKKNVVGTNVSIIWLSNDLSFGVPASKINALLEKEPLTKSKENYRQELHAQFQTFEKKTMTGFWEAIENPESKKAVHVGNAVLPVLPKLLNCWDRKENMKVQKLDVNSYSCNLQFTPTLGDSGEIGSIEISIVHAKSSANPMGFADYVTDRADGLLDTSHGSFPKDRLTAPQCASSKILHGKISWLSHFCISGYVHHPSLYRFSLVGSTLSKKDESIIFSLVMTGFTSDSFERLSEYLFQGIQFIGSDRS